MAEKNKIGKYECPKIKECKNKDLFMKGSQICGHWNWVTLNCEHKD
jgi:hypothetical protein